MDEQIVVYVYSVEHYSIILGWPKILYKFFHNVNI